MLQNSFRSTLYAYNGSQGGCDNEGSISKTWCMMQNWHKNNEILEEMLVPQHEQVMEYELSIYSTRKSDYKSPNCKDV